MKKTDMLGTFREYETLAKWLYKNNPDYLKYMYDIPHVEVPLANFTEEADRWLWNNCRNRTVIRELRKHYSKETLKRFENENA